MEVQDPALQTYDVKLIKQLSLFAVHMTGSGRGIIGQVIELKRKGAATMDYLRKEYHFE